MDCIIEYIPYIILVGILGFLFGWVNDKLDE